MKTDKFGRISVSEQEAFDLLYNGKLSKVDNLSIDSDITQFNQAVDANADRMSKLKKLEELTVSLEDFDRQNQSKWFMPDDYCPNLFEFIYSKCSTEKQRSRVDQELELFAQHKMIDLLYYLKYLVDTMRNNNIVWGVGRGSSVASYVLYLIGVHKIDSIKYNLDIHEFLKEK